MFTLCAFCVWVYQVDHFPHYSFMEKHNLTPNLQLFKPFASNAIWPTNVITHLWMLDGFNALNVACIILIYVAKWTYEDVLFESTNRYAFHRFKWDFKTWSTQKIPCLDHIKIVHNISVFSKLWPSPVDGKNLSSYHRLNSCMKCPCVLPHWLFCAG